MRNLFFLSTQIPSECSKEKTTQKHSCRKNLNDGLNDFGPSPLAKAASKEVSINSTGATSCFDCVGVAVLA